VSGAGLVVVGAGLAGVRAVEAARRTGFDGPVTLLGAEHEAPYDRPPLSKTFFTEGSPLRYLRTEDSLRDELDVDVRLGVTATGLDVDARVVATEDGDLPYDGLVIATGSAARTLAGMTPLPGVHTLRTHTDALALRAAFRPGVRVVVVGAGFIGSEVACSAQLVGAHVTVLEAAAVPLVRAVGQEMGAALGELHRRRGIEVRCGAGVESFEGTSRVTGVVLNGGEVLPADVVVVGVGAAPLTGWLDGSGLELADGIVCDSTLRARAAGVYAAGDVARWFNPAFDRVMRLEHWTAAAEQGAVAGHNAVQPEDPTVCETVPYFWSDWGTDRVQFVGIPESDEVAVVAGDPGSGDFLALFRSGDRLTGALGLNQRRPVIRLRALIAARTSWSDAVEVVRDLVPAT
jgi:NADPH-dependent 2,4-dienoyl-CoA reductase/sulfur reductase-like enzyme